MPDHRADCFGAYRLGIALTVWVYCPGHPSSEVSDAALHGALVLLSTGVAHRVFPLGSAQMATTLIFDGDHSLEVDEDLGTVESVLRTAEPTVCPLVIFGQGMNKVLVNAALVRAATEAGGKGVTFI